jgi:hypothetical protein
LLVELVYRSLFLRGEESFRLVDSYTKLLFIGMGITCIIICGDPGLIATLLLCVGLGLYGEGKSWAASSLGLSSIPAAWYGLTAYFVSVMGYGPRITLWDSLMIYTRVLSYSEILIFAASIISPLKLTNLLIRLGGRTSSIIPPLIWRLTPMGLRYMVESLEIGRLKGEPASKRLAPAIAVMLEAGRRILEANYYRLDAPPMLPVKTSSGNPGIYRVLLAFSTLILLVMLILHVEHIL